MVVVVVVVAVVVGENGSGRVGVIESVIIDAVGVMKIRIVIRTVVRIGIVLGLLCRLSVAIARIEVGGMIGIEMVETTVVMTGTEGIGIAGIAETETIGIGTTVIPADTGTVTRDRIVGIHIIAVHHRLLVGTRTVVHHHLPVDRILIDSVHQRATATTGDPATSTVVLEIHTVETTHPTAQALLTATARKPKTSKKTANAISQRCNPTPRTWKTRVVSASRTSPPWKTGSANRMTRRGLNAVSLLDSCIGSCRARGWMIGLRGVGEGWLLREMRIDFDQASSIVFVLEWDRRWLLSRLYFSSCLH